MESLLRRVRREQGAPNFLAFLAANEVTVLALGQHTGSPGYGGGAWLYTLTALPSGFSALLPDTAGALAQVVAGCAIVWLALALRTRAQATAQPSATAASVGGTGRLGQPGQLGLGIVHIVDQDRPLTPFFTRRSRLRVVLRSNSQLKPTLPAFMTAGTVFALGALLFGTALIRAGWNAATAKPSSPPLCSASRAASSSRRTWRSSRPSPASPKPWPTKARRSGPRPTHRPTMLPMAWITSPCISRCFTNPRKPNWHSRNGCASWVATGVYPLAR